MEKNTINTLLAISSGALAIGGLILLVIEIFSATKDNILLWFAIISIILSNFFNLIRSQRSK